MKIEEIKPQIRVSYTPVHNKNAVKEYGTVSSINDKYAFVRFDTEVTAHGWEFTTSKACNPTDLTKESA